MDVFRRSTAEAFQYDPCIGVTNLPEEVDGFHAMKDLPFVETSTNRKDVALFVILLIVFFVSGLGMMMFRENVQPDEIRKILQESLRQQQLQVEGELFFMVCFQPKQV